MWLFVVRKFWQFLGLVLLSTLLGKPAIAGDPFGPVAAPIAPESYALEIEIRLSARQLALYRGTTLLRTYPVAVGREGWQTPTGTFEVLEKIADPAWMNPFTRRVIAGGSVENPLGRHWLGFWTDGENWVGMHGTPNPESVGRAASHGCIRLHNEDIRELFTLVGVGTPVRVVH
jgi:lipoprotein-anchoring transpeptidase ErfK/SrfK